MTDKQKTKPKADKADKADKPDKTEAVAAREKRAAEREVRRPKRSDIPDTAILNILSPENPRREGTGPYAHFEKYQNGMTVGDLLSETIGGEWVHLQADIERGYVEAA